MAQWLSTATFSHHQHSKFELAQEQVSTCFTPPDELGLMPYDVYQSLLYREWLSGPLGGKDVKNNFFRFVCVYVCVYYVLAGSA